MKLFMESLKLHQIFTSTVMFVSAFLISEPFMHFGALLFRKLQSQELGSAHTGHKEDAPGRFFSGNTKEQNIYRQF